MQCRGIKLKKKFHLKKVLKQKKNNNQKNENQI